MRSRIDDGNEICLSVFFPSCLLTKCFSSLAHSIASNAVGPVRKGSTSRSRAATEILFPFQMGRSRPWDFRLPNIVSSTFV